MPIVQDHSGFKSLFAIETIRSEFQVHHIFRCNVQEASLVAIVTSNLGLTFIVTKGKKTYKS